MQLQAREMSSWPLMTWCAEIARASPKVRLLHGSGVEVCQDWAIEGAWAGEYREGAFDRTSLVFGSGIRLREEHVEFVASGSNVDRLWIFESGDRKVVSNSLPALLAIGDIRLLDEVSNYPSRIESWTRVGMGEIKIPSSSGPIRCLYFHNMRWDGRTLRIKKKPQDSPTFSTFGVYRDFLFDSVRAVVENARSRNRTRPFSVATTVSSGYDSSAAAVAASRAGCTKAVTIESARSTFPRSDSGLEVAEQLGLECDVYPRGGLGGPDEISFWAATGDPNGANFAVFDFEEHPCLLLTGVMGGLIWTKDVTQLALGLRATDPNVVGICEFRLRRGIVHLPVPFLGARRAWEICELSHASEMDPYRIGGHYDRPIPRRILEEAGVPRATFGMKKSATQFAPHFLWPYRSDLQESYRGYLEERGIDAPPVRVGRALDWMENNVLLPARTRLKKHASLSSIYPDTSRLLFQWANHTIAQDLAE